MIEKGHLYLAQHPLYKITKGSKNYYIKNEKELENFLVKSSDATKKEVKKKRLFFFEVARYHGGDDFLTLVRITRLVESHLLWTERLKFPSNGTVEKCHFGV